MLLLLFHLLFCPQILIANQPSFEAQTIDDKVSIGYGLALGDVDGDGKPDILMADKKQFVWYRNGDWKRFVMIENLTVKDNVCIAARDITGDGKVEVAVGAQWDPGETRDTTASGSVHYLVRPQDPTQRWQAIALPHEPTVHRMKWVRTSNGNYYLVVVPLNGRENTAGIGRGVKVIAYRFTGNPDSTWPKGILDSTMHMTHNFEVSEYGRSRNTEILLGGKEGVLLIKDPFDQNTTKNNTQVPGLNRPVGELRKGRLAENSFFLACVEPMHGNELTLYLLKPNPERILLDDNIKEGHAVAVADFSGSGRDQVVMGWRAPNKDGKVGVKIYSSPDATGRQWNSAWIDDNGMACEDIQVMDLNADGKPDIVASGRSTHNLKIYWNR